jgi:non-ribosomal peptide synthase protein (TIGR01720 family)
MFNLAVIDRHMMINDGERADVAVDDPDGAIEFAGRADDQVKVRGFRVEPGEVEAVVGACPGVRSVAVTADRADPGSGVRLVAYVAGEAVSVEGLREWTAARLPGFMVPAVFVIVDDVPVGPTGKVDRAALPAPPQPVPATAFVAPRTDTETVLARVWQDVLGVERVGLHDDFFELGGDSILAIQVASRAGEAGVEVSPGAVFEFSTVRGLAGVAGQVTGGSGEAEQGRVHGEVGLTPIQRWFFEQPIPVRDHWNQARLLVTRAAVSWPALVGAVNDVVGHHDALRLRFSSTDGHVWQQVHHDDPGAVRCERVDAVGLSDAALAGLVADRNARTQPALDLTDGPLSAVVWFDRGPEPGRLLIVIHHLVVDEVSWAVVIDHLERAYTHRCRDQPTRLPAKTASFQQWSTGLDDLARSPEVLAEAATWSAMVAGGGGTVPVDGPGGPNTFATMQRVETTIDAEHSDALLRHAPAAYRTQVNDLLLAALAMTLTPWTGSNTALVDLEGHGREDLVGLDVSRTVGWFTTLFPVRLHHEPHTEPGDTIIATKEHLRALPHRGLSYGLLRYHPDPDLRRPLLNPDPPTVRFNYLGQPPQPPPGHLFDHHAPEPLTHTRHPDAPRTHLIDIIAAHHHHQLHLTWTYSPNHHRATTITALAHDYHHHLTHLINHCRHQPPTPTPTDFPLANLDHTTLQRIVESQ